MTRIQLFLVLLLLCGSVSVVTADESYQIVAAWGEFGSNEGQFMGACGLAVDDAGSVYVVDDGNSRIQKFTPRGAFIRTWGEYGTADGQFKAPTNLAFDSAGDLYVVDGSNANVQVFTPDGTFLRKWGTTGSAPGPLSYPEGIAIDGEDNVYIADMGNDRVQKFASNGTFITGWGADGTGAGQFKNPYGIAVDPAGDVYVADTLNNRVQKFAPDGAFITAWGTEGQGDGQFLNPLDLAVDGAGNVYVTDTSISYSHTYNDRVQKFTSTGAFITKWGGSGNEAGQFNEPNGIAVDGSGTVFVADKNNDRVQVFTRVIIESTPTPLPTPTPIPTPTPLPTPEPTPYPTFPPPVYTDGLTYQNIATWGSKGTADGQFDDPGGIDVDWSGTVYVVDSGNNRVQKFDGDGTYLATWGEYGNEAGQFDEPNGIAVDGAGNVFVTDSLNHRVQKFDSNGTFLKKWGGVRGSALGQFFVPVGIAVDGEGNIFVADQVNNRTQVIAPNGTFSAWGTWGTGDGQFEFPRGIEVDAAGNVYVADTNNNRVQKFTPDGTFLAAWGSPGTGDGQLYQLRDLAVDAAGTVFVADTWNYRVQKFTPDGAFITTWGKYGTRNGQFRTINGVSVDDAGSVYVVDSGNNRVQKFSLLDSRHTVVPAITWQRCLGGSANDDATDVQPTADGGFVLVGSTLSNDGDVAGNHGKNDVWVTRLDAVGGLVWQRCLGGRGSDSARSVQQTSDGGYILAGRTGSADGDVSSWNEGPYDGWIVKLNATGHLSWERCLGGTKVDEFSAVQQTVDGGYILAGHTHSDDLGVKGFHVSPSGDLSDGWVVKVDAMGHTVWQSCLGGTGTDEFKVVEQTPEGGYILVGETSSNDGDVSGFHLASDGSETDDIWLVKLDAVGNLAWQRCLGGTSGESGNDVIVTADGGYVVAGGTGSSDGDVSGLFGGDRGAWIVRVDAGGVPGWQGGFEGFAESVRETPDGGLVISGSFVGTEDDIVGARGEADFWVAMLDAAGVPVWQRCLGGTAQDIAHRVLLESDGSIVLAGNSGSTDKDVTGNHGGGDIWVAKLAMESPGVASVPGGTGTPTDTDGDRLFDDVNGNARADFADVVLYFNQMTWIAANEPISAFDYNKNGRIDFADVVWLFNHL